MIRGLAPIIGLLAVLAPATAYAQTNLDRGKSASQLFSAACVECHKAPHGLSKGKSAAAVAEFLGEHYTTSREQAASLAAYVVGGRDTVASPVPGQSKRTLGDHAGTTAEDPKRHGEKPKPGEANAKPRDDGSLLPSLVNPIVRPEPGPATATRNRRKEPPPSEPAPEPASLAHAPAPVVMEPPAAAKPEMPSSEAAPAPTATAPVSSEPGEPVPRDNVPD